MVNLAEATITQGSNSVTFLIEPSAEKAWDKQLTVIDIPKQDDYGRTLLIDLKRVRETFKFNGYIIDDAVTPAVTKVDTLRQIIYTPGTMTLQWDTSDPQQPYIVNILKASVKEEPGEMDDGNPGSDTRTFSLQIQFVRGEHKG